MLLINQIDTTLQGSMAHKYWHGHLAIDIRVYRKEMGNQAPPQKMPFACTLIILIAHNNWVTYHGHGVQVVINVVSHVSELNSVAVRTITIANVTLHAKRYHLAQY